MVSSLEIYVLNKALKLYQPENGFRTCMDSVLLAAACPAQPGHTILDLGSGVGGAGLCVLYRVPDTHLTGIEIQGDHIPLAEKNAQSNNLSERCVFIHDDIRTYKDPRNFDHVICNPPYMEDGTHLKSPHTKKALAHGGNTNTEDWTACAYRCLKPGGSFTMIHRADQTDKIIQSFTGKFGAIDIIPLWPKAGSAAAKRVIIRALKDRKSPAKLHAGLVLHEADGTYTLQAQNILRAGESL